MTQTLTHSHQQPAHVSCVLYMYTQTHLVKFLQVGQSGITGPEKTGQTLLLSLWQTHTRHWRDCLVVQGQTWNTTTDNMRRLDHNIINTEQAGNAFNTLHTESRMCSIIYNILKNIWPEVSKFQVVREWKCEVPSSNIWNTSWIIFTWGSFKFESNNNHNGEDIKNISKIAFVTNTLHKWQRYCQRIWWIIMY